MRFILGTPRIYTPGAPAISLTGSLGEQAVNHLQASGLTYAVATYDNDDQSITSFTAETVSVFHGNPAQLGALGYTDEAKSGYAGPLEVFIYPNETIRGSTFEWNRLGNQIRTIVHESLHLSGALDSRRDQILTQLAADGVHVTQLMAITLDEILVRQATLQVDIASDSFRAFHHRATIEEVLQSEFYADGIVRTVDPITRLQMITTPFGAALTPDQRAALIRYFNSPNYVTPVIWVDGQYWANGRVVSVPPSIDSIAEFSPGDFPNFELSVGVISLLGSVDGIDKSHKQSAAHGYSGYVRGSDYRIWDIGNDGDRTNDVFVDGKGRTFERTHDILNRTPEEEQRANENLKHWQRVFNSLTNNEDNNSTANGAKPILLDLDGDGIEITELDRSTTFMDASGSGLKHRTAWAGKGDGVLFWDADNDGLISDDREYIFTEWDPTAGDDLAALRSRFDTNGDGKLSGAELDGFKVMVTADDGTTTAKTLALPATTRSLAAAWTTISSVEPVATRSTRVTAATNSLAMPETTAFSAAMAAMSITGWLGMAATASQMRGPLYTRPIP